LIKKVFNFVNKYRENKEIPKEDVARIIKIYDDLDFNEKIELYEDKQAG
jgi:hypothetical protein